MSPGKLFVISAPSGAGKTTLVERLLRRNKGLAQSVSVTTRPPRKGERQGRDYCFLTAEEFLRRRRRGDFLEWAVVFGYYYGTPRRFVEEKIRQGKNVIACLDVQGAKQVKKKWPQAVLIFVLPPKIKDLLARLKKRKTDSTQQIRIRLKTAQWEIRQKKVYDCEIVNDRLSRALKALEAIVTTEKP